MIGINTPSQEHIGELIAVRASCWLDTYPNEELGVTKEFLLRELDQDNLTCRRTEDWWLKFLSNPDAKSWAAFDGAEPVGYLTVQQNHTVNTLDNIYILSRYRSQGLGRLLLVCGLEWLGDQKPINLHVVSYNRRAQQLYRSFGFEVVRSLIDEALTTPTGHLFYDLEMVRPAR